MIEKGFLGAFGCFRIPAAVVVAIVLVALPVAVARRVAGDDEHPLGKKSSGPRGVRGLPATPRIRRGPLGGAPQTSPLPIGTTGCGFDE